MLEKAKEYREYARECVRMAEQADSEETRGKLLELARVWTNAALLEEEEDAIKTKLSSLSGFVH
jgi:hypothetical protein